MEHIDISIRDIVTAIVVVIGGYWALHSFSRNNRIKAAELMLAAEKEYAQHIDVLLSIENMTSYNGFWRGALSEASKGSPSLAPLQIENINKLEAALRHLFVSNSIRSLGVDAKSMGKLHAWYLNVLVTDASNGKLRRPEMREYIKLYWPTVYFWAELNGLPFPKRLQKLIAQVPDRIALYWQSPQIRDAANRLPIQIETTDNLSHGDV